MIQSFASNIGIIDRVLCIVFVKFESLALQALITIDGKGMSSVLQTRFDSVTFRCIFQFTIFRSFEPAFVVWYFFSPLLSFSAYCCELRINVYKINRIKGIHALFKILCTESHLHLFTFIEICIHTQPNIYNTHMLTHSLTHSLQNWIFKCNHWDWKYNAE